MAALSPRHWCGMAIVAGLLLLPACAKKVTTAKTPPPPPPAPAPTATIAASPETLEPGQATQLNWRTENASTITINGLGTVPASGSRQVTPTQSTTYQLTAVGPGGSADASARVTVNAPPVAQAPQPTLDELFTRNVTDVFFAYDKYEMDSEEQSIAQKDAQFLATHPDLKIQVEGHCDERGSVEYNLALGDNRANAVKEALVRAGVTGDRIKTVSYGKERPFCNDHSEECWHLNRRGHIARQ